MILSILLDESLLNRANMLVHINVTSSPFDTMILTLIRDLTSIRKYTSC